MSTKRVSSVSNVNVPHFTTETQQTVSPIKKRRHTNDNDKSMLDRSNLASPTGFIQHIDEQYIYGQPFTRELPTRKRIDNLFNSIVQCYTPTQYRKFNSNNNNHKTTNNTYYNLFSIVQSPIRKPTVYDTWSLIDIAKFETGIATYGKNFRLIRINLLQHKTTNELVEFYYKVFKQSVHYNNWKRSTNTQHTHTHHAISIAHNNNTDNANTSTDINTNTDLIIKNESILNSINNNNNNNITRTNASDQLNQSTESTVSSSDSQSNSDVKS